MHFTNKFFIWWCLIFIKTNWHYFDIFCECTFFIFFCDRPNVIILKIHYESIIFLKFIQMFFDHS
jgi:hypothetical protein